MDEFFDSIIDTFDIELLEVDDEDDDWQIEDVDESVNLSQIRTQSLMQIDEPEWEPVVDEFVGFTQIPTPRSGLPSMEPVVDEFVGFSQIPTPRSNLQSQEPVVDEFHGFTQLLNDSSTIIDLTESDDEVQLEDFNEPLNHNHDRINEVMVEDLEAYYEDEEALALNNSFIANTPSNVNTLKILF